MSVLIKGMEMPSNCFTCPVEHEADCDVYKGFVVEKGKRYESCPLIPIPPHGDLIDRDALEQEAQKRLLMCNKNDNQFQKPYEVMRAIVNAPTIIPAEKGEQE